MSLATVVVSISNFQEVFNHLLTHMPKYQNMHMREARIVNKKRELRYLHAMKAHKSLGEIEGMISGPDIFYHYKLKEGQGQTQVLILSEKGSLDERKRLGSTFVKEILHRVEFEKQREAYYPKRIKGQFYLKRKAPGTSFSHPHCQAALTGGVLEKAFLEQLSSWNLALLYP